MPERADGGDGFAAGNLSGDELGVVHDLLSNLRLGKLGDFDGLILEEDGKRDFMVVIGNRRGGFPADKLPAHGQHNGHNQNENEQVDQIDLAEQTALFINNFHTCLQYLWIWLILRAK